MILVYTPGVWDLLHVGHVAYLERARAIGDRLVVGVPSDEVVCADKDRWPVIPLEHRVLMLQALRYVDVAAPYYTLRFVPHLESFRPDVLVVGEDWGAEPRHAEAESWCLKNGCRVVQLPRTPGESTTAIRERIRTGG